jgi:hypothetical protein
MWGKAISNDDETTKRILDLFTNLLWFITSINGREEKEKEAQITITSQL